MIARFRSGPTSAAPGLGPSADMGIELKLRLTNSDPQRLDAILRQGPFFSDYDSEYQMYNFRGDAESEPGKMPDVSAAVEADGLYVCENASSDIVEEVTAYLKRSVEAAFGYLDIEEL